MASDPDFMEYVREQIQAAGQISYKKMFGEYAVYCDGKVVGFVCDNQLFVKPTEAARALLTQVTEGQPYPGAKLYWVLDELLDDPAALSAVIAATARALPLPKPKKPKAPKPPKA